jgi:hypothetical protein
MAQAAGGSQIEWASHFKVSEQVSTSGAKNQGSECLSPNTG